MIAFILATLLATTPALDLDLPAWENPSITPSPPPRLTGKQMGIVETVGIPPLGYELDGDVKVFTLIAQPVEGWITDGEEKYWGMIPKEYLYPERMRPNIKQWIRSWGYNGTVPGPTIEVIEGDQVRIVVRNELPEPTTVHWHGIELPNHEDGAGGVTQYPILPGETYTYEFTVYQQGTFMYHTGFNVTKQDISGMGGFFVAQPKDKEERADRDFAIMLNNFEILPGNDRPILPAMDSGWWTMNGHTAPSIPTLTVNEGETVRIRFGNLSIQNHPIHIHGYTWEVIGTEGGPIPKSARWPGATVDIAPGQTRTVEFVAWNPGIWRLHCHKVHHIINQFGMVPWGILPHGGMYTYVYVIPKDPDAPWQHPTQLEVHGD